MIPIGSLSCGKGTDLIVFSLLTTRGNVSESSFLTHSGVLKVVQAAVRQDEPAPLPGFHSAALEKRKPTFRATKRGNHFLF